MVWVRGERCQAGGFRESGRRWGGAEVEGNRVRGKYGGWVGGCKLHGRNDGIAKAQLYVGVRAPLVLLSRAYEATSVTQIDDASTSALAVVVCLHEGAAGAGYHSVYHLPC